MEYEIQGGNLPVVICQLTQGETMITESGSMAWMGEDIQMDTNMKGGLFGGIGRMLTGESLFLNFYKCTRGTNTIAFASSMPGSIVDIDVAVQPLICQKDAFLCAEDSVELKMHFVKKFGAGLFGGEGFILQLLSGRGKAFLEIDGACIMKELTAGEVVRVDTGHVAAFEESVSYSIERVKGFRNIVFGGEGLFLTKLTGPGKVWLQTMPVASLASKIIPFVPKSTGQK